MINSQFGNCSKGRLQKLKMTIFTKKSTIMMRGTDGGHFIDSVCCFIYIKIYIYIYMYIKQNNWFLYAWLMVLVFIVRFFTVRSLLTVVVVFLLYAFVELWISLLVIFFVVLFSCRINDLIKTFLSNLLIFFVIFFLSCSEIDFVFAVRMSDKDR